MRVLNDSAAQNNYHVSQFLRGAIMYVHENRWRASWIGFATAFSLYFWVARSDAGYGFALSLAAFILTFWWIFDPMYKQSCQANSGQEYYSAILAWVVVFRAPSLGNDISETPSIGLTLFLSFTSFALAWPWIERRKTPDNLVVWLVGCAATFIALVFIAEFVAGFLT